MIADRAPMRLYSGPLSMYGMKAEIAAREKGLDFELISVAFSARDGYEPKHPEVLRINPKRQVPVLIHGELEIFDSTQIFEYFEDIAPTPPLWPNDAQQRAEARLLELQSDEVYFPHIIRLMSLQDALSSDAAVAACDTAQLYYQRMEERLAARDHIAGDYSYADIAFFMAQLFGVRMGAGITDATPRLIAWRERVMRRPAVRAVMAPLIAYLIAQKRPVPEFLQAS